MEDNIRYARILTILFIIFIVCITLSSFLYIDLVAKNALKESARENLIESAALIANQLQGDDILRLQPGDESTQTFISLRDTLNAIRRSDARIKYLYILRQNGNGIEFVVDAGRGTRSGYVPIGFAAVSPSTDLLNGFSEPSAGNEFVTDEWGTTISGYAPVLDSRGNVAGLVGVDMDAQEVKKRMEYISTNFYALLIIILTLLVCGAIIFDIRRTRVETMIHRANSKLNLLNSIIRHDITNTLTVLIGYEEMTEELTTEPEVRKNLSIVSGQIQKINRQIAFTRDYQNLGMTMPEWQNVEEIVSKAASELDMTTVQFTAGFSNLNVYADPLLERVFLTLLQNSLEHGETVTQIRGSYRMSGRSLILVLEDNGRGVPEKQKNAIFKRKYYKNTGLGLFLVREILSMTNISISETGVPGKGARFEISVPKRGYRFTG